MAPVLLRGAPDAGRRSREVEGFSLGVGECAYPVHPAESVGPKRRLRQPKRSQAGCHQRSRVARSPRTGRPSGWCRNSWTGHDQSSAHASTSAIARGSRTTPDGRPPERSRHADRDRPRPASRPRRRSRDAARRESVGDRRVEQQLQLRGDRAEPLEGAGRPPLQGHHPGRLLSAPPRPRPQNQRAGAVLLRRQEAGVPQRRHHGVRFGVADQHAGRDRAQRPTTPAAE